jgi:drug/metabolite transporter (DMT)-like permease
MAVVLLAALLHAGWNALVKSGEDKLLDAVAIMAGGALIALAALPFLIQPAPASRGYLLASGVIHVGYTLLVAAAYRGADLSYGYPMMRGTAPLIVALASGTLLGEPLTGTALLGVGLIGGGLLVMALGLWRRAGMVLRPTAAALGNALVIAAYTIVDGIGARLSGAPFAYVLWVFLLSAPPLLLGLAVARRGRLARELRRRWPVGLIGGAGSVAAYGLALWAMTEAPIALVAALRETSIVFATLIGAIVLDERIGLGRALAAAAVAGGAVALRLG